MAASIRILVVDGARTMLIVVRKMLLEVGYPNVDTTDSGTEALRLLRTRDEEGRQYAAAILDQTMAPLTGVDLRRAMLANRSFAKIPAILMTSSAVAGGLVEAVQSLFSSLLLKPFGLADLRSGVDGAIGRRPEPGADRQKEAPDYSRAQFRWEK